MIESKKSIACADCVHRDVCCYKQDFEDICDAVYGATVRRILKDEQKYSIRKIIDFECLDDILIMCRYYRKSGYTTRECDIKCT